MASPYATTNDLILTGDVQIPAYLDKQKFIDDAADEIDSNIGFVYTTPVDMTDTGPVSRPARLLLKRINVYIASCRLLLSAATGGEESQVHAYGLYLLKEGEKALQQIASGEIELVGATTESGGETPKNIPLISNVDAVSSVDTFYGGLVSPGGFIDPKRPYTPLYYPLAGG